MTEEIAKDLAEKFNEKKGVWLRIRSENDSSVSVFLYNPEYTFKLPFDDADEIVDILRKPMREALELVSEMNKQ